MIGTYKKMNVSSKTFLNDIIEHLLIKFVFKILSFDI